jgi:DNA polymerase
MKGFFEMSAWQGIRQPLSLIPECGKCKLDLGCLSPRMPVSGAGRRKILIVAEAPGSTEDERNKQLVGESGYQLVRILHKLGVNMRKDCWLTNAIICRPPKNRDPNKNEIDYCRPNLTNTIERLKPDMIIPMGKFACQSLMALAWKDGEVEDMASWAGWKIPCQKLNTWICPTWHPSFLLRTKEPAVEMTITRHLREALEITGKPYPDGPPDYKKQIRVEMDPAKAAASIKTMMAFGRPMAIDIETSTLKPDGPFAEILCCAVSDGRTAIAFPWIGEVLDAVKIFLLSRVPKIVANLRFESRWFLKFLKVFPRHWQNDTLLMAHILNCIHGICSLKFQSFVLFGIPDYDSHIEPYKKSKKGSNGLNRMKELEPAVMMEYCAYDALFEAMVSKRQLSDFAGGVT